MQCISLYLKLAYELRTDSLTPDLRDQSRVGHKIIIIVKIFYNYMIQYYNNKKYYYFYNNDNLSFSIIYSRLLPFFSAALIAPAIHTWN